MKTKQIIVFRWGPTSRRMLSNHDAVVRMVKKKGRWYLPTSAEIVRATWANVTGFKNGIPYWCSDGKITFDEHGHSFTHDTDGLAFMRLYCIPSNRAVGNRKPIKFADAP